MKTSTTIILILAIQLLSFSQTPFHQPGDWTPILIEEFDNLNHWKVAHEFDHYGEPQVYTNRAKNVFIRDIGGNNHLVLKTCNESYTCGGTSPWGCSKLNYDYTSGWVETKSTFNTQYGFIEARIKNPKGKGLWPAFWTFIGEGVSNGSNAAEIDIFEMNGNNTTDQITNLHLEYGAPNFHGISFPEHISIADYSTSFHTYGLKWTPTNIYWYFDNQEIRKTNNPGIIDPVRIILNVAIWPNDLPDNTTQFPTEFIVDFVKVYEYNKNEFIVTWNDHESGKIAKGHIKEGDVILKGDFYQSDGKDELLICYSDNKYVEIYDFDGLKWDSKWTNGGSGEVESWRLNDGDIFEIGDYNGDGHENLLAISLNTKWSQLYLIDDNGWNLVWHNNGNGEIKWWYFNQGDKFIAGDFDGDGKDELLAVSLITKWSQLYSFENNEWIQDWSNNGNGKIKWWVFNQGDDFIVGDFDGDGKDELLIVSFTTKWSQLYSFENNEWIQDWSNNGNGKIKWWLFNENDKYTSGDFDKDGNDELLCFSNTKWIQCYNWSGADWNMDWTNDGTGNLGGFNYNVSNANEILSGNFHTSDKSDLFFIEFQSNPCIAVFQNLIRYLKL